jgi:hypothetical protein
MPAHARVHVGDGALVGHVAGQGHVAGRAVLEIDADDGRALAGEDGGRGAADAALGAGDHADLAVEAH